MSADPLGDIWVVTEQRDGHTQAASYALIGKARRLADVCQSRVAAVCLRQDVNDAVQLAAYGADKVYLMNGPSLDGWNDDVLAQARRQVPPGPHTTGQRRVAPPQERHYRVQRLRFQGFPPPATPPSGPEGALG